MAYSEERKKKKTIINASGMYQDQEIIVHTCTASGYSNKIR